MQQQKQNITDLDRELAKIILKYTREWKDISPKTGRRLIVRSVDETYLENISANKKNKGDNSKAGVVFPVSSIKVWKYFKNTIANQEIYKNTGAPERRVDEEHKSQAQSEWFGDIDNALMYARKEQGITKRLVIYKFRGFNQEWLNKKKASYRLLYICCNPLNFKTLNTSTAKEVLGYIGNHIKKSTYYHGGQNLMHMELIEAINYYINKNWKKFGWLDEFPPKDPTKYPNTRELNDAGNEGAFHWEDPYGGVRNYNYQSPHYGTRSSSYGLDRFYVSLIYKVLVILGRKNLLKTKDKRTIHIMGYYQDEFRDPRPSMKRYTPFCYEIVIFGKYMNPDYFDMVGNFVVQGQDYFYSKIEGGLYKKQLENKYNIGGGNTIASSKWKLLKNALQFINKAKFVRRRFDIQHKDNKTLKRLLYTLENKQESELENVNSSNDNDNDNDSKIVESYNSTLSKDLNEYNSENTESHDEAYNENGNLIIENPIINKSPFEGVTELTDDELNSLKQPGSGITITFDEERDKILTDERCVDFYNESLNEYIQKFVNESGESRSSTFNNKNPENIVLNEYIDKINKYVEQIKNKNNNNPEENKLDFNQGDFISKFTSKILLGLSSSQTNIKDNSLTIEAINEFSRPMLQRLMHIFFNEQDKSVLKQIKSFTLIKKQEGGFRKFKKTKKNKKKKRKISKKKRKNKKLSKKKNKKYF